jgi:hypothetical protein
MIQKVKGNGEYGKPSRTLASFQLPGLACFGGALRSFILPNDCGREGVTDFLVEATFMVASSSVVAEKAGQHGFDNGGELGCLRGDSACRNCAKQGVPLRESIVATAG